MNLVWLQFCEREKEGERERRDPMFVSCVCEGVYACVLLCVSMCVRACVAEWGHKQQGGQVSSVQLPSHGHPVMA